MLSDTLPLSKSRIHSVQSSLDSPIRSSTPRIPPGLSLPHAHPSPSFAGDKEANPKEAKASSITPGPVTPALPILPIGYRSNSPRATLKETQATAKPEEEAQDISGWKSSNVDGLNSGKVGVVAGKTAKKTSLRLALPQMEISRAKVTPKELSETVNASKLDGTGWVDKQSTSEKVPVPLPAKLDISSALSQKAKSGVSPSKPNAQILPQSVVGTPTAESLPDTLTASTTKSPDWISTSRPRTLRLTTTTTAKPETAPASAVTERSTVLSAALLKQTSRQPSLSSVSRSRPSTPTVSEHGTSTGISRAGSPPVSDITGSAPEKAKSRSQAKKERKAKTKTTNESKDEDSLVSTPTVSEEVGPIISRQKKKKRTQDKSDEVAAEVNSGAATEREPAVAATIEKATDTESRKKTVQASALSKQDHPTTEASKGTVRTKSGKTKRDKKNTPAASTEKGETQSDEATQHKAYTLNDLFNDAAKLPDTGNALSDLLNASISATTRLLQELLEANDVDMSSALFNAPPLTSYKLPPQPHKGADYLDANGYTMNSPFGEIYLSGHDRKQLLQGRDVRLSDPNKPQNTLKRIMITPTGAIFRHLSAEEEERVIELENRRRENEENFGVTGKSELQPLDEMDFMNLTGGLQELMAFPPLHRISLLTAEPGTEGAEDDDADLGGHGSDETEDEMAPLASGFGAAPEGVTRKPMTPNTMKRKAEALKTVNLRNLDVDKLVKRIRETQVEMEGARKEMEALEKKATRKAKDVARWREALLKEVGRHM
jgi:CCR4-NOT transcription complex subunit 4